MHTKSRKSNVIDYDELAKIIDMDAVNDIQKKIALNPEHPVLRGTAQNPDIFFQAREACNHITMTTSFMVCRRLHEGNQPNLQAEITSSSTTMVLPMQKDVIIAMGSACEAIEETIDYLRTLRGEESWSC